MDAPFRSGGKSDRCPTFDSGATLSNMAETYVLDVEIGKKTVGIGAKLEALVDSLDRLDAAVLDVRQRTAALAESMLESDLTVTAVK